MGKINIEKLEGLVMPFYYVTGYERTINMCYVEADTPADAIEKAWCGDCIEGTQETESDKNIQKKSWSASEAEAVLWDGKGFGRPTTYREKA